MFCFFNVIFLKVSLIRIMFFYCFCFVLFCFVVDYSFVFRYLLKRNFLLFFVFVCCASRFHIFHICCPNCVQLVHGFMDANPMIGASGGALELIGDADEIWKFPLNDDDCKAQLLFGVPVSQGTSILRNSIIKKHDIRYAEDLPPVGEDWLYWLQWASVSSFGNLEEPLIKYRRGEHNASFGRDRYEDHKELFKRVFQFFDIPLSDDSLELHFYTMKLFRKDPTAHSINAFREHLNSLQRINIERSIFPMEAFSDRLERSWNELFFYLPKYGRSVVKSYKNISGGLSDIERRYYFRFRLNKFLGRS